MNEEFWDGFWVGFGTMALALLTAGMLLLLPVFVPPSKSKAFVSKYCIEKQDKEACEILGDAYGK